jgi:hypothetical protein
VVKELHSSGGMMALFLVPAGLIITVLVVLLVWCSKRMKNKNKCCTCVDKVLIKIYDTVCFNMIIKMVLVSYLMTTYASGIGRQLSSNPTGIIVSWGLVIFSVLLPLVTFYISVFADVYELHAK